ncbi:MAG: ArsI/CadI family heavy metal resistance metalloenzyme [Pseudoxanthomonas sp.]
MNRFHVHVNVADLGKSVSFYSELFGAAPSVQHHDYAKWMIDDPQLNFAISTGQADTVGIAHLGLQATDKAALAAIGQRLNAADAVTLAEANATCCYAKSDKFWAEDPQGVRWETFHTHGTATTYGGGSHSGEEAKCCGPETKQGECCDPKPELSANAPCCA